ncbi:MAG: ABC transporter permease [Actinomycetota bacterium]
MSSFFYRHPAARLAAYLLPGVLWLVVLYLGSIAGLLVFSFYRLEEFTGLIERTLTLSTYAQLLEPYNRDIIVRTAGMAAVVTVASSILAFPVAYYAARYATPRVKTALYLLVLMPLWSSYLVRALAWRQALTEEGIVLWALDRLGLSGIVDALLSLPVIGGPTIVQSYISLFIVYVYLWLPFMILPVQTSLERVPESYLEASADLGAHPRTTFRRVTLPLAVPGLVAGSIFTFSLTLGDFILPSMFGASKFFMGQQVYVQQGVVGNLPLAAAFTFVAMAIMIGYLLIARRTGAFEAL